MVAAGNMLLHNDNIAMFDDELESLDIIEEENDFDFFDIPSWTSVRGSKILVNVDSFGAVGDGVADDTQAFQKAWDTACSTSRAVLLVPQDRRYLVNATKFQGPCAEKLVIQIDGTIVAPDEPKNWNPKFARQWLDFTKLEGVIFQGQGVIDGSGDDCVSIVNASSNIKMKRIYCGPGHGISIGSLGKDNSIGIVTRVVLDTAVLKETTNGLRIKTWQGGSGYVQAVRFQNVKMIDVANPIIIDQFYCDSPKSCENQTSAVSISKIIYKNISGTTTSKKAMKFACSDTVPCSNIVLRNVNLEKKDGTVETYCNSAQGFGYGNIHPSADCLSTHDDKNLPPINQNDIVHTEL
ncbi:hypothetical protein CsatA_023809 [Cannabis sativa]